MYVPNFKYSILEMWMCSFCVVALLSCFGLRSKSPEVKMVLIKSIHSFENTIHLRCVVYLYHYRCCLQVVGLSI